MTAELNWAWWGGASEYDRPPPLDIQRGGQKRPHSALPAPGPGRGLQHPKGYVKATVTRLRSPWLWPPQGQYASCTSVLALARPRQEQAARPLLPPARQPGPQTWPEQVPATCWAPRSSCSFLQAQGPQPAPPAAQGRRANRASSRHTALCHQEPWLGPRPQMGLSSQLLICDTIRSCEGLPAEEGARSARPVPDTSSRADSLSGRLAASRTMTPLSPESGRLAYNCVAVCRTGPGPPTRGTPGWGTQRRLGCDLPGEGTLWPPNPSLQVLTVTRCDISRSRPGLPCWPEAQYLLDSEGPPGRL